MNKTLLLLIVIFASLSSSSAQKVRFTDSTNVWWEEGAWMDDPTYVYHKYHYDSDSMINGENYRMMFDMRCTKKFPSQTNPFPTKNCKLQFVGFMREDTTNGIVYFGEYAGSVFSEDTLYDYNWQVEDTFATGVGNFQLTVLAIDTVLVGTDTHWVWQMQFFDTATGDNEDFHIIEGIGNTWGLFHLQDGQPYFESGSALFCFRQGISTPPLSKTVDAFDNQTSCVTSVDESKNLRKKEVAVIPHPANVSGYFQFPYQLTGTVTIVNQVGQIVRSERIVNKDKWMLEGKIPAAGLYIYNITHDVTGEQLSGKLIYQ